MSDNNPSHCLSVARTSGPAPLRVVEHEREPSPPTGQRPKLMLSIATKSAGWPEVNVTYTSCTPLTPVTFAGTERHDVQPPVFATAKLPITADVGESSRTSTRPDTPPEAPEATFATN